MIAKTGHMTGSRECSREEAQCLPGSVKKLSEFMLLSREERTAHIDLTTPCDFTRSGKNKVHLVRDLGLEDDVENWITARIHRCHLCECGRRNGNCANPRHMYFGTAQENTFDLTKEFRQARSSRAGSASKGRPDGKHKHVFEQLLSDCLADVAVFHMSSRKLGAKYNIPYTTIQKWKKWIEPKLTIQTNV